MKAGLCVAVLAVFLAQASALDCYVCSNCGDSDSLSIKEQTKTCYAGFWGRYTEDQCEKWVNTNGSVTRSCSTSSTCEFYSFRRCHGVSPTGCMSCCSWDYCNSALNVKGAGLAVVLALATAFFAARF